MKRNHKRRRSPTTTTVASCLLYATATHALQQQYDEPIIRPQAVVPWQVDNNRSSSNNRSNESILSKCYNALQTSDTNSDGKIQPNEYTQFISILSNEYFTIDEYTDLPNIFKVNFNYLSCRCKFYPINANGDCCQGNKKGVWYRPNSSSSTFIVEETLNDYVSQLCSDTLETIHYERGPTLVPTERPSITPSISLSPSTTPPTITNTPTKSCIDKPDYKDQYGDTCSFYEDGYMAYMVSLNLGNVHPCLVYGEQDGGSMGTPNENCCVCIEMLSEGEEEEEGEPMSAIEEALSGLAIQVSSSLTLSPTGEPSLRPEEETNSPTTRQPVIIQEGTNSPSEQPSARPISNSPSRQPSLMPVSTSPTRKPTLKPVTDTPSNKPSQKPISESPTRQPSIQPTSSSPTASSGPTISLSPTISVNPTFMPTTSHQPTKYVSKALTMEEIMALAATNKPSPSPVILENNSTIVAIDDLAEDDGDDNSFVMMGSIIAVAAVLSLCISALVCIKTRRRQGRRVFDENCCSKIFRDVSYIRKSSRTDLEYTSEQTQRKVKSSIRVGKMRITEYEDDNDIESGPRQGSVESTDPMGELHRTQRIAALTGGTNPILDDAPVIPKNNNISIEIASSNGSVVSDKSSSVSAWSSSAGDSGWSSSNGDSETLESAEVKEEEEEVVEEAAPIDMHWEGMGRIASMLADDDLFDTKEISDKKKKGGFFSRFSKKKNQNDEEEENFIPAIDEEEEKRKRNAHINSLLAKGDFEAVAKYSEKYKSVGHHISLAPATPDSASPRGVSELGYGRSRGPPKVPKLTVASGGSSVSSGSSGVSTPASHFAIKKSKSKSTSNSSPSTPGQYTTAPKPPSRVKRKPKPLPLSKQYNAQRINMKLIEQGADATTATRVAKIVQDHALDWNKKNANRMGEGMETIFDVDEVMTVMSEYGLDGNDIANVFEKTPSVSMIKARADDGLPSEEMCKALIHVIRGSSNQ